MIPYQACKVGAFLL